MTVPRHMGYAYMTCRVPAGEDSRQLTSADMGCLGKVGRRGLSLTPNFSAGGDLGQVHEPTRTQHNSEERREVNPRLAFLWKNKKGMESGCLS